MGERLPHQQLMFESRDIHMVLKPAHGIRAVLVQKMNDADLSFLKHGTGEHSAHGLFNLAHRCFVLPLLSGNGSSPSTLPPYLSIFAHGIVEGAESVGSTSPRPNFSSLSESASPFDARSNRSSSLMPAICSRMR